MYERARFYSLFLAKVVREFKGTRALCGPLSTLAYVEIGVFI